MSQHNLVAITNQSWHTRTGSIYGPVLIQSFPLLLTLFDTDGKGILHWLESKGTVPE